MADILISIEKVTFKSIDTTGLLRTLHSREPVKILQPKPERGKMNYQYPIINPQLAKYIRTVLVFDYSLRNTRGDRLLLGKTD